MLYTIEEETLNGLADAVRLKAIGQVEPPKVSVENQHISYNNAYPYELPVFVKKTKIIGYAKYNEKVANVFKAQGLGIAPGKYGQYDQRVVRKAEDYTIIQETRPSLTGPNGSIYNFNFEIIIEGNTFTFVATEDANGPQEINLSFEAIGLDENGNEFKYTPLEMIDEISGLNLETGKKLKYIIEKNANVDFTLTAEDLNGITRIGNYAFYDNDGLRGINFPEGITKIDSQSFYMCGSLGLSTNNELVLPSSLTSLETSAFGYCNNIYTIRILNNKSLISIPASADPFNNCNNLTTIYVPNNLYNGYCNSSAWSIHKNKFVPVGEWVFEPVIKGSLLFNQSKEYTISLNDFDYTPEFSITSSNPEVATVSDIAINEDNSLITFKVNSLAVEGNATINVSINSSFKTFEFSGEIRVYESFTESSYEVVPVDGATYGFALNDAGYWESQNKKKGGSYALCQINISNMMGKTLYLDCINYAESNYDYGILGSVNQVLVKSDKDDSGVKQSFKGKSSPSIITVEYTDAIDDCFIQVKYKKDVSGDQNNDSIQFQVRFGD